MSDIIDRAQAAEERDRQVALDEHAYRTNQPDRRTETTCIDCEEEIDPRRLAAHPTAMRCIDCQIDFERKPR